MGSGYSSSAARQLLKERHRKLWNPEGYKKRKELLKKPISFKITLDDEDEDELLELKVKILDLLRGASGSGGAADQCFTR